MVTFIILITVLLILTVGAVALVGSGGVVFLLAFGDIVVAAFLCYKIVNLIVKGGKSE